MTIKSATHDQLERIKYLGDDLIKKVLDTRGCSYDAALRILNSCVFKAEFMDVFGSLLQKFSDGLDIVSVPDISTQELIALSKSELRINYFDDRITTWDFYHDKEGNRISGCGESFEVMLWKPVYMQSTVLYAEQARSYFNQFGFTGNVSAFIEWRRQMGLKYKGYHATVPEESACFLDVFYPYSNVDDEQGERDLGLHELRYAWGFGQECTFVAFRKLF